MNARIALIVALSLAAPVSASAQAPVPAPVPADVNRIAHQMAERVRHLGEDIASDLGTSPAGKHLIQDTQELAQSVDEFHDAVHDGRDPSAARQAYAGIDATWQHLRGQLARGSSPAVDRAAARVEEQAAQLRQALGLNAPPPGFYGGPQAPTGIDETRRLAHALADRSDALAAVIQADMRRDPNGADLARDAAELARLADGFHDAIDANQPPQVAARALGPIDAIADRLERYLAANRVSPRVRDAWQGFASARDLIRRDLIPDTPPAGGGPPTVADLSGRLVEQVDEFLGAFGPISNNVPQGNVAFEEAQRLQAAAANFREDAARGLAPNQLAYEFRDVDAAWRRLARRVNRMNPVARDRIAPHIDQIRRIGDTCAQAHRALGMPGYAPVLGGPGFGPRDDPDHDHDHDHDRDDDR